MSQTPDVIPHQEDQAARTQGRLSPVPATTNRKSAEVKPVLAATTLVLALSGCAATPQRASGDYRFEALPSAVRASRDAEISVRLVRNSDGSPVRGAVITEHRFEMMMGGYKVVSYNMIEGRGGPAVLAVEEPAGVYRVHAQLPMAGTWQATLTAQIPGSTETFRGTVPVAVVR